MTDPTEDSIVYSDKSVHEVLQQQVAAMLANADISEEQKQEILVAMQCPCCGSGGFSLSIKLRD